jgi:hypothetical protein
MRPNDPRVLAVAAALVGLVDALLAERRAEVADELVPLADAGIERRALRRLQRDGRLPVERIGRRLYTRRSALLALVITTPAKEVPPNAAPVADVAQAAREAYAGRPLRIVGGKR